jgi:hypothetical protein
MTLEGSNSAETFPPGVGGVRLHTGKIREVSCSLRVINLFALVAETIEFWGEQELAAAVRLLGGLLNFSERLAPIAAEYPSTSSRYL